MRLPLTSVFVLILMACASIAQEPGNPPEHWIRQLGSGGIPIPHNFQDAKISRDGKYVAVAVSPQLCVVQERESGKELFRVKTFAFPFGSTYETLVDFTPNSRGLVVGTTSRFQLVSVPDGKKIQQFANPKASPAPISSTRHAGEYWPSVCFDSKAKIAAVSNHSHEGSATAIQLLDVETGKPTVALKPAHNRHVSAVISPDGTIVATYGRFLLNDPNRRVFTVEIVNGKEVRTPVPLKEPDETNKDLDRVIQLWDAATGKEIGRVKTDSDNSDSGREGSAADVTTVRFTPDGKTLVAATRHDGLFVYDVAKRQKLRNHRRILDLPNTIEISPNGQSITEATYDSGFGVATRSLAEGDKANLARPKLPSAKVLGIAHPDAKSTIVLARFGSRLGWWNPAEATGGNLPLGHVDSVVGLAFDPTGRTLRSISIDERHILWDLNGAIKEEGWVEPERHEFFEVSRNITLSPNSRQILKYRNVWLLCDISKQISPIRELPNDFCFPTFSSQGDMILLNSRQSVLVFDLANRRIKSSHKLESADRILNQMMSADQKRLAVITETFGPIENWLQLIDNDSGKMLERVPIDHFRQMAFSPDSKTLVVASAALGKDGVIKFLDATTLKPLRVCPNKFKIPTSIAFSGGGKWIALGCSQFVGGKELVEVWLIDSSTGEVRRRFQKHDHWIKALAFSPDGSILASGGEDDVIHLWRIDEKK